MDFFLQEVRFSGFFKYSHNSYISDFKNTKKFMYNLKYSASGANWRFLKLDRAFEYAFHWPNLRFWPNQITLFS
jgi:hypothetical protein